MDKPMNQRNSKLHWLCSISRPSERTLLKIDSSMALSNFTGAMLGRPPLISAAYMLERSDSIFYKASLTIWKTG